MATNGRRVHMRAMVLGGHGGFDQLQYVTDFPLPVPDRDEVLVEVAACGMNNTDVNTRTGWYSQSVTSATGEEVTTSEEDGSWTGGIEFPLIQGADPVGRVVDLGSAVDPELVGRRVMIDPWLRDPGGDLSGARYLGSERNGGYAEYVAVPSSNVHPIESRLTDVELASFPCSYSTAEHMLVRAGVKEGDRVVVTGASGGVGTALVQLARRRGAVTVAISSAAKMEGVRRLAGAHHVIDRRSQAVGDQILDLTGGVDVVADVAGGPTFGELFGIIRRGGHYTVAGAIAGPRVDLDLRTLYLRDITMHGCTVTPPHVFADLVRYIETGQISPLVAASYPLDRFGDAQEAFLRKEHVGAIVIEVKPTDRSGQDGGKGSGDPTAGGDPGQGSKNA